MAKINLMALVIAGIMIIVVGFVLSIGQSITSQNTQTICSGIGGSWLNTPNASGNGSFINPFDGSYAGCCLTPNTSTRANCDVWLTTSYAINSSYYSASAMNTLAYWIPIIALAIAAGFVISILIVYLLGSVTGRHEATV